MSFSYGNNNDKLQLPALHGETVLFTLPDLIVTRVAFVIGKFVEAITRAGSDAAQVDNELTKRRWYTLLERAFLLGWTI